MDANSQRCLAKGTGGVGNVGADVCFGELSKSKKKGARLGSDRIAEKFKGGSNFYYPSPSGFISLSSWMVGLFA